MKITRHTGITRFGKHERPVTVRDDDGRLFDTVLFFVGKEPTVPEIEAAATDYVARIKTAEAAAEPEIMVPVSEINSVLSVKGITESWEVWKKHSGAGTAARLMEGSE